MKSFTSEITHAPDAQTCSSLGFVLVPARVPKCRTLVPAAGVIRLGTGLFSILGVSSLSSVLCSYADGNESNVVQVLI